MKPVRWMLYLTALLVVVFFVAGGALSLASRDGGPPGLLNGRLAPCPQTPNCVCSECSQEAAFVMPMACEGEPNASWALAQMAIIDLGGSIEEVDNDYLAATFQTPLFHFTDDVELRLDRQSGVVHVRSASRVGRSDLGTNRERVEAIRHRYQELAAR